MNCWILINQRHAEHAEKFPFTSLAAALAELKTRRAAGQSVSVWSAEPQWSTSQREWLGVCILDADQEV